MSEDPSEDTPSEFWTHLTLLAKYHRWAIIAIGLKLGAGILTVGIILSGAELDRRIGDPNVSLVAWFFLATEVFAIVALTLLLKELTNWPTAISAAGATIALALFSNYSLVVLFLLLLHVFAMRYFRKLGVEVGLLGAKLGTL